MNGGAWQSTVHGVAKSNFTFTKKQEAPHTMQGHMGSTRVHHGVGGGRSQGMHGHKSLL